MKTLDAYLTGAAPVRPVVLADLDDTLFQTDGKTSGEPVVVAAVDRDGAPRSYMTAAQANLLRFFIGAATVIPVTGRSVEAFRRVTLPFDSWAVCSHGGVILQPDGEPDQVWLAHMRRMVDTAGDAMDAMRDMVIAQAAAKTAWRSHLDIRCKVIVDAGLPLYLSVKTNDGNHSGLASLGTRVAERLAPGWTLHVNGNNMALMIPGLSKQAAVEHLKKRLTEGRDLASTPIIGLGDSLTDWPFMAGCHLAGVSQRSQLARALDDRVGRVNAAAIPAA